MKIIILGWGSLIWCPGGLRIKTRWHGDGPSLPIEFARISQDDRLTLVIQPGSARQSTYWAVSEFMDLKEARQNLKTREKTKSSDIHHVLRDGTRAGDAPAGIAETIAAWMSQRGHIDAVVWTGLPSNWREKRGRDFAVDDARDSQVLLVANTAVGGEQQLEARVLGGVQQRPVVERVPAFGLRRVDGMS
jgi:hypothetical protein